MTHTSVTTTPSGQTKPIVFFGTEDFSADSLEALISRGYVISAIVTKPDTRRGRGKQLVAPRVKEIGIAHNIPVWQPAKLSAITDDIRQLDAPIGVLVSFGKIIPQDIIDLFSPGIINVHPSLLPQYRGPSPIETAILNDDSETGISIMQLSAAMDAGPVYTQTTVPLRSDDTAPLLYEQLGRQGAELLANTLPDIIDNSLHAAAQNDTQATYCQLISKTDGVIDWSSESAARIERKLRAYLGWPGCTATLGSMQVVITGARIATDLPSATPGQIHADKTHLFVAAADNTWLEVLSLKPVGKKEMPIRAFLAGYRDKLA